MKKAKTFMRQNWITISLLVLLAILTIAIRYFTVSFEESYVQGEFHKPEVAVPQVKKTAPVAEKRVAEKKASVDSIQSWMTFDYINVVYKLPKNYMKDILGITDSKYPNIRIDTYANQSSIDTQLLLTTVRTYVTNYQNQ